MFMRLVKTAFVEAMKNTFTNTYPEAQFRNLPVSIEYPVSPQSFPSIWVDFTPTGPIKQAGVGHLEIDAVPIGPNGQMGQQNYTRFFFSGSVSFTVVAMSSNERDFLFDEVQRVIMAGDESVFTSEFRQTLEAQEFIEVYPSYSQVEPSGFSAAQGTPWGSDEILYEATLSTECEGTFAITPDTGEYVLLSKIEVSDRVDETLPMPPISSGMMSIESFAQGPLL